MVERSGGSGSESSCRFLFGGKDKLDNEDSDQPSGDGNEERDERRDGVWAIGIGNRSVVDVKGPLSGFPGSFEGDEGDPGAEDDGEELEPWEVRAREAPVDRFEVGEERSG